MKGKKQKKPQSKKKTLKSSKKKKIFSRNKSNGKRKILKAKKIEKNIKTSEALKESESWVLKSIREIHEAPETEKTVSYFIRVMPELSAESLQRLIQPKPESDDIPILQVQEIEEMAAVPSLIQETEEPIPIQEETAKIQIPKRTNPQPKKLHAVKQLTFYRIGITFLWPFLKIAGVFYWTIKVFYIRKRKKREDNKFEKAKEDIVDVFAHPPKKTFREAYLLVQRKAIIYSLGILLAFALPSFGIFWYQKIIRGKNNILLASEIAIESLKTGEKAAKELLFDKAAENFKKSKKYFKLAKSDFYKLDSVTKTLAIRLPKVGKNVRAALTLMDAGENIAEAAEKISLATHTLLFEDKSKEGDAISSFLNKLSLLEENIDFAIPKVAQAKINISSLDPEKLTLANSKVLRDVQVSLPALEDNLSDMSVVLKSLLRVLGYQDWQRYLFLFENNNEMRATGGFIGSFALVDIEEGKIKNMEIPAGGSYDLQGGLLAQVASPTPLRIINPVWEFQDSNWWPDFPATAQKISWFYQKSQGPSVDGVVAITSSFIEDLLEILGPIEMEGYGRVITAGNFVAETQKIVEKEYDKDLNRPKQFISDFAPVLFEKMFSQDIEGLQKFFEIAAKALKEKQIVLYSNNTDIQKLILDLDWGGEQKTLQLGDYLSVINSNIGGGKTDGVIEEIIEHTSQILEDGKILNTVRVTRTHKGNPDDEFEGAQNVNYVRVYVPRDSIFLSASGFSRPQDSLFENPPEGFRTDDDLRNREGEHFFEPATLTEIYTENDKTVFANWIMVKPGESKTYELKYFLPSTIKQLQYIYSATFQKQIGSRNTFLSSKFIIPENFQVEETYPEFNNLSFTKNFSQVSYASELTDDIFYAALLKGE